MIDRIEAFHNGCFLHRDIKPDKFLLEASSSPIVIYLIDYGLSKYYINSKGDHIQQIQKVSLIGTARNASISVHDEIEQLKYSKNSEFQVVIVNIILANVEILFIVLVFNCINLFVLNIIFFMKINNLRKIIHHYRIQSFNQKLLYCQLDSQSIVIFFPVYFYELPLLQISFFCQFYFSNLALIFLKISIETDINLHSSSLPMHIHNIHYVNYIQILEEKYIIDWIILFSQFSLYLYNQSFCQNIFMKI
ncbi:unnamed protein product [Paramecium pentaurelia]|uniref:Casein kinase I n=1 Tax=Paramecium pentaurelia TaxID=43138 RepID=A0A8S1YJ69_9CILI|nr:unnamed protein product [Paramecium pentaurelia]